MKSSRAFAGIIVAYILMSGVGGTCVAKRNRSLRKGDTYEVGCVWFAPRVDFVASRKLASHHRIVASDLAIPEGLAPGLYAGLPRRDAFVGRYLAEAVSPGQRIPTRALLRRPRVTPVEGTSILPIRIPDDSDLSTVLDVGWTVDLGHEGEVVMRGLKVLAIDCPDGAGCTALLELPDSKRAALAGIDHVQQLELEARQPSWEAP